MKKILTLALALCMMLNSSLVSNVYAEDPANDLGDIPYTEEYYFMVSDGNGYGYHYEKDDRFTHTAYDHDGKHVEVSSLYDGYDDDMYLERQVFTPDIVELPYIESNGSQFIDTGIIPSEGHLPQIEAKFQLVDFTTNHQPLFGTTSVGGNNDGIYFETNGSTSGNPDSSTINFSFGGGVGNDSFQYRRRANENIHRVTLATYNDYYYMDFDTFDKYVWANADGLIDYEFTDRPLYLFANNKGENTEFGSYRMYGCKIYKEDGITLLRDFVPAAAREELSGDKVSTGETVSQYTYGMYDVIEGKFYPNLGDGEFTCNDSPVGILSYDEPVVVKCFYDLKTTDFTMIIDSEDDYGPHKTATTSIFYGETFELPDLDVVGYDLIGWNNINGNPVKTGPEYLPGDTYTVNNNHKGVYACLVPHSYAIAINYNGGTWGGILESNIQASDFMNPYGYGITIDNPVRAGYEFTGWTITGMDDFSKHYINGDEDIWDTSYEVPSYSIYDSRITVANLTSIDGGVVTFTANWAPVSESSEYIINFYYEGLKGPLFAMHEGTEASTSEITSTPNEFIRATDSIIDDYMDEGYNYDKFIDLDDDGDEDILQMEYLETESESIDISYVASLAKKDKTFNVKDIQDVQFIDTGLTSGEVYGVDMEVAPNNELPPRPFGSSYFLNWQFFFSALNNTSAVDISDNNSFPAADVYKHWGLSMLYSRSLETYIYGGSENSWFTLPASDYSGDFYHINVTRDDYTKTVSAGYGFESELEGRQTSSAVGIAANSRFLLFAGELKELYTGSSAKYGETIIYGKDNEILRDYIPAIALDDITAEHSSTGEVLPKGTIGMYDRYNEVFYPNAGNGEFRFSNDDIPAAAGYGPANEGSLNIVYERNTYSIYLLDPIKIDGMDYYLDEYVGESPEDYEEFVKNNENIINYDGSLYRVIDKIDYKWGMPIEIPEKPIDQKDYAFIKWSLLSYLDDSEIFLNYINEDNGGFVTLNSAEPAIGYPMPKQNIYLVADYYQYDELSAPTLNIPQSSTYDVRYGGHAPAPRPTPGFSTKTLPLYEVELGQTIALSCEEKYADIFYGWSSVDEYSNDPMSSIYTGPLTITYELLQSIADDDDLLQNITDVDEYIILYAYANKGHTHEDSEVDRDSYSRTVAYVLHVNLYGDITSTVANKMHFGSIEDVPHTMWLANTRTNFTYDPTKTDHYLDGDVYYFNKLLKEGVDYTKTYINDGKAGEATLILKGKGNYSGTKEYKYIIRALDVKPTDLTFELNKDIFKYNGKIQKPSIKNVYFSFRGKNTSEEENEKKTIATIKLKNGVDYKLIYEPSSEPGIYSVHVNLLGNYAEPHNLNNINPDMTIEVPKVYSIAGQDQKILSSLKISGIKDVDWIGDEIDFGYNGLDTLVIKDGKFVLVEGRDYKIQYLREDKKVSHTPSLPGTYYIQINGTGIPGGEGKYVGTYEKKFTIKGVNISKVNFSKLDSYYVYNPLINDIEPVQTLTYTYKVDGIKHTYTLLAGRDYKVTYDNNKAPGTATITYRGIAKAGFVGEKTVKFKIKGTSLSLYNKADLDNFTYTGYPLTQSDETLYYTRNIDGQTHVFRLASEELQPVKGDYVKNFEVIYSNNENAGTATITYKGVNTFTGSVKKTFKIAPLSISEAVLNDVIDVCDVDYQDYQKGGAKPDVEIIHHIIKRGVGDGFVAKDKTLELGKDYTLSYKNNSKPGLATVTIKGKGNYTGTITKQFLIGKTDLYKCSIKALDKAFTGKTDSKVQVTVYDPSGKKLTAGSDYDKNIVYEYLYNSLVVNSITGQTEIRKAGDEVLKNDIVFPGTTIKVIVTGKGNYTGTLSSTYTIDMALIENADVKIRDQYYTSNGPVVISEDDITVTYKGQVLSPEQYEIVSYKNNDKAGTAEVTIRGTGVSRSHHAQEALMLGGIRGYYGFSGEKTVKFKIVNKPIDTVIFRFTNTSRYDHYHLYNGEMPDFVVNINSFDDPEDYVTLPNTTLTDKRGNRNEGWEMADRLEPLGPLDMVVTFDSYTKLENCAKLDYDFIYNALQYGNGVVYLYPNFGMRK